MGAWGHASREIFQMIDVSWCVLIRLSLKKYHLFIIYNIVYSYTSDYTRAVDATREILKNMLYKTIVDAFLSYLA